MPRDSNGIYTLPLSNPVHPNTIIQSEWANDTEGDEANELSNSLDRQGRGGMLTPLRAVDGTAGGPRLAFVKDPASGMYHDDSDRSMYISLGGQNMVQFYSDTTDPLTPVPSINFIARMNFEDAVV